MRLIKINHTYFVIAKTIAITCFLGITDNKINSSKTSLTKGEANLGKKIILSWQNLERLNTRFNCYVCAYYMASIYSPFDELLRNQIYRLLFLPVLLYQITLAFSFFFCWFIWTSQCKNYHRKKRNKRNTVFQNQFINQRNIVLNIFGNL